MFKFLGQCAFALAPVVGYFPQWLEIRSTGLDTFSSKVCLALLVSNISRVFFWFTHRFDSTLLYQALMMILVQLMLLDALVKVKIKKNESFRLPRRESALALTSTNGEHSMWDLKQFWAWRSFTPYVQALTLFAGLLSGISIIYKNNVAFSELLGSFAVALESCVAIPQLFQNFSRKSTAGLSFYMIMGWVIGDSGKLFYFLLTSAPYQFVYGSAFQLCTDSLVFIQMKFLYPAKSSSSSSAIKADADA